MTEISFNTCEINMLLATAENLSLLDLDSSISGGMAMTALEYMQKQVHKHRMNYKRESARGVSEEMLNNIEKKIGYYEAAVNALKRG